MRSLLFTLFSVATVSFLACSSSSTTSTPTDAGGVDTGVTTNPVDAGGGTDADNNQDTGPAPLNGCAMFTDNTANTNTDIVWGFSVTSDANHCSRIKAGTTVTWTGDFVTHPLVAFGGDTPSPLPADQNATPGDVDASTDGGSPTITITFPTAGTFGYHCFVHASMLGAIEVVP
jgi:plastocyanin